MDASLLGLQESGSIVFVLGKAITKQRLSHWIVNAITLAYSSSGLQVPAGLRAHSAKGLTTTWTGQ